MEASDRNAHDAFVYTANAIRPYYRNVEFCFLELDRPNIEEGIGRAVAENPSVILIVPYFLHKGAHIKRDVIKDLNAPSKSTTSRALSWATISELTKNWLIS